MAEGGSISGKPFNSILRFKPDSVPNGQSAGRLNFPGINSRYESIAIDYDVFDDSPQDMTGEVQNLDSPATNNDEALLAGNHVTSMTHQSGGTETRTADPVPTPEASTGDNDETSNNPNSR